VVTDLQKMVDGISVNFNSYQKALDYYGLTNTQEKSFITFVNNHHTDGYIINVVFNDASEKAEKKGNDYLYQVTTETKTSSNEKEKLDFITYELLLEKNSFGNFKIKNLSVDSGHSIEGQSTIASNAVDDLIQNKLDDMFKNSLLLDSKHQEAAKTEIEKLILDDNQADNLYSSLNFQDKGVKFLDSDISLKKNTVSNKNGEIKAEGTYILTVQTKQNAKETMDFNFSIDLAQSNPDVGDFYYVINDINIHEN
jgi:hypothetical protein